MPSASDRQPLPALASSPVSGSPAVPSRYFADEAALAGAIAELACLCDFLCDFLCERLWVLCLAFFAGIAPVSAGALAEAAGAVAALEEEDEVCANDTAATPEISAARRRLLSLDME